MGHLGTQVSWVKYRYFSCNTSPCPPSPAYRDSSGTSPLQARHIMMPPTRARPPATHPTKRAEPKVYLQNRRGWLGCDRSCLLLPRHTEPCHPPSGSTVVPRSPQKFIEVSRSSQKSPEFPKSPTCSLNHNSLPISFLSCKNRDIPAHLLTSSPDSIS